MDGADVVREERAVAVSSQPLADLLELSRREAVHPSVDQEGHELLADRVPLAQAAADVHQRRVDADHACAPLTATAGGQVPEHILVR